MNELYELAFGALLHDIGKFYQRAFWDESILSAQTLGLKSNLCPTNSKGIYTHKHVLWTNEFFEKYPTVVPSELNISRIANIASYHHAPNTPLEKIVQFSDRLSASIDRKAGEEEEKPTDLTRFFLKSIFGEINIGKRSFKSKHFYYLMPLDVTSDSIFPVQLEETDFSKDLDREKITALYADLWHVFEKEILGLKDLRPLASISRLKDILLKYTWSIPSSTIDIPDISLYDHLITTTIIAVSMYLYFKGDLPDDLGNHLNEKMFVLVGGDISGIQSYLYEISHVGAGGVAKRLRARSFFISMFSEIASHKVMQAFGMPTSLVLMSSGGNFVLLLPAIDGWQDVLENIKKDFDDWCYNTLNAELRISISGLPYSYHELSDSFYESYFRLHESLQHEKNKSLYSSLTANGKWQKERFVLKHVEFGEQERLCASCRKFPGIPREEEDIAICDRCYQDQKLGEALTRATHVAFFDSNPKTGGKALEILGKYLLPVVARDLKNSSRKEILNDAYIVYSIGDEEIDIKAPILKKFIANYIPVAEKNQCDDCRISEQCEEQHTLTPYQPLLFKCIAATSNGWQGLGFLKVDVDNLGMVFAEGLGGRVSDGVDGLRKSGKSFQDSYATNRSTISRFVSMSRLFDLFFSARINSLLETSEDFNNIYTVYSGGDDLLMVGPWDKVISFADSLNSEFRRYTCKNPSITLSAGLATGRPNSPVSLMAKLANIALDKSKETAVEIKVRDTGGKEISGIIKKNSFTFFEDTMPWDSLNFEKSEDLLYISDFLEVSRSLADWLREKKINNSQVWNLLNYGKYALRYFEDGDALSLRFVPLLAYDLARNWPAPDDSDMEKVRARKWAQELMNLDNPVLKHLSTIASYALLVNRY